MTELGRIGVALSTDLLERFDELTTKRGYTNRSEAFRDLIRAELFRESAKSPTARVVGTITMVYDHHVRLLNDKLIQTQHDFQHLIITTLHVHLDHDHCLEVIVVRGKAAEIEGLANSLIGTKGVKHGQLTPNTRNAMQYYQTQLWCLR